MSFSSHQHTSTSKGLPLAAAAVRRGESMARQMEETTMSKMMSVSHTLLREMVRVRVRVGVGVRVRVRVRVRVSVPHLIARDAVAQPAEA